MLRALKIYIIIPSINELVRMKLFDPMLMDHECKVLVIDEGILKTREKNRKILSDSSLVFYGPSEREEWFKQRFGLSYKKYSSVIPERCHAETSFGFLVAHEEEPDFIIELDDDVIPIQGYNILSGHAENLYNADGMTVYSKAKWYNTMENLELNVNMQIFPRGHPFAQETRRQDYVWSTEESRCVLNMGMWIRYSDLDALTILYHGGLDGRCEILSQKCKRSKVIVGDGTYYAVCSMNTAFIPKIIPAFYQLYMKHMGVDRFDDIWSGIFLKKIADEIGNGVCLGQPVVCHDKRARSTFKDLRAELEGMVINEILWRIVDELELEGKTYFDAYHSLICGLEKNLHEFYDSTHRKFMKFQTEKMNLWLEIIDKLQ